MVERLLSDIEQLVDEGFESVGILCKTAERSKEIHNLIEKRINATLLTRDDMNFSRGIIVLPVYLAKGLEFDAAMVLDADRKTYGLDQDRKIFYTACTRALHRLKLYCCDEITPFVRNIPEEYYESVII